MCIILTCEKNVRPNYDLIEDCFWNNPDGAGIMWCEDGRVQTSKGFSTPQSLFAAIESVPMESRLVVHMRIATSGGIDVGTCHPFPICNDLDILHEPDVECSAAIAHNGIISDMPTDKNLGISDTISFVLTVVNDLYVDAGYKMTKSVRRRIKNAALGNRFALMTSDGEVYRLGVGWQTVTKGIHASNGSWRYTALTGRMADSWDKWSDDDYYDWWEDNDASGGKYDEAFDTCCGDCACRGTCMAYGPTCEGVAEYINWYMDEQERLTA